MPRHIVGNPAQYRRHTIACIGDSLTKNNGFGTFSHHMWPEQMAIQLRAQGALVKARNFGRSGNTTGPFGRATTRVSAVASTTSITVGTGLAIGSGDVGYINGQATIVASYTSGSGVLTLNPDSPVNGMLVGMQFAWVGPPQDNCLTRLPEMIQYDVPDIAIIFAGVNDPANLWNSQTAPTTGVNTVGTVQAGSTTSTLIVAVTSGTPVVGQAVIVGAGQSIQYGIAGTVTGAGPYTIGLLFPLRNSPTIGGYFGQGTQPNLQYMAQWLINMGCPRIAIASTQVLNYPGGQGDFSAAGAIAAGSGSASGSAAYAVLRPYLYAAATAAYVAGPNGVTPSVIYVDLFDAMAAIAKGLASYTGSGPTATGTNPFGATNIVPLPTEIALPDVLPGSTALMPSINYAVNPGTSDSVPSAGGYNYHVAAGQLTTYTISAGGTGYVVNDIVTFTGTHGSNVIAQVTAVTTGAITAIALVNPGTGVVSGETLTASGGTGTGATLAVTGLTSPNQHLNRMGQYVMASIFAQSVQNAASGAWLAQLKT